METMCKHCDELTNKVANLEAVSTTPTKASKKKSSIFNMSKKDASTSCNDLCLDSSLCNQVCVEKVVVDTCTQEVAKENEQLKQEVARLTKDLTQVKGKTKQAQLHQDNTVKGVKKLDEGQIMVCYVCHKEGHKSYECKVKNGGGAKKKENKQTSKLTNTYTNKVDKKASTPYLLKKNKNDKVVAIKVNKQAKNGVKRFWVPKEIISNMKSTKKVWIPKGK